MGKIRICLVAPPYSGHLNPLLGLGRELLSVAEVTVVSTPLAMAPAKAAGLRGYAIMEEGEKLVMEIASPGRSVKGNPFLLFQQLRANVSLQKEMLAELDQAFDLLKPDLVIADFTLPVSGVVAERRGVPWWTSLPSPCVFEAPDGPPAYFGGLFPAASMAERLVHAGLRKLTRLFKRLMFFIFRKTFRSVGLAAIYREDGSERAYSPERILACGMQEIEFPRTYPPHFHFIGPLLYTPPVECGGPDFENGGKHVLVTLGSHLVHQKDRVVQEVKKLAEQNPEWIFHFTDGDAANGRVEEERNFRRLPFISYDAHLPAYDAVIHHGGSGILHHCLKHGIPSVVVPMDFDQFDNAARLSAAGVAVWARSLEGILPAFCDLVKNHAIKARCLELKAAMGCYDPGEEVRAAVRERFGL